MNRPPCNLLPKTQGMLCQSSEASEGPSDDGEDAKHAAVWVVTLVAVWMMVQVVDSVLKRDNEI